MEKNKTINRMQYTPSELHIREAEEGKQSRTITGYAILFDTPSAPLWSYDDEVAREVIAKGAITKELLDGSDIKMTMFHDRQLILARSNQGEGTLTYTIDDRGVAFEFEAPRTADGDKALELVRRGDISGCSFAFTTHYYDDAYVARDVKREEGITNITYTVRTITGIYDFTLAADPAYPDTTCEAEERELVKELREAEESKEEKKDNKYVAQIREMRRAEQRKLK